MGRPRSEFPTPGKRQRGGKWELFFWARNEGRIPGGRTYGLTIGDVTEQEAETRRMELELALRTGQWPAWAIKAPGVQRYFTRGEEKAPTVKRPAAESAEANDAILADYRPHLEASVSPSWAVTSLAHLRELADVAKKPLTEVTPADAEIFLTAVMTTPGRNHGGRPRCKATANRARASCSRFYRWAVRAERVMANPFAGLPGLREDAPATIVYLTRPERDAVLEAARDLPDGIAVEIALLAGLRRGEVIACRWEDILEHGRLRVPTTKTGRPRIVPLQASLLARLTELRPQHARGRVMPWPADPEAAKWRARLLLENLQPLCPDIPSDRIRWNAFRHTFGSLLAQAGVSLDKISAWMGNSPAVCRRHYAEFVPRDERDEDIDRL
jgi:integrase